MASPQPSVAPDLGGPAAHALLNELHALYRRSEAERAAALLANGASPSPQARRQAVLWMYEAALACGMREHTLHTAIINLDRYTAANGAAQLRLMALASLRSAAGLCEAQPQPLQALDAAWTSPFAGEEVCRAGISLLSALGGNMSNVTPRAVARALFRCVPTNRTEEVESFVTTFIDLAHTEAALMRVSPFAVAVACCVCSIDALGCEPDLWIGAVAGMVPLGPLQDEIAAAMRVLPEAYTRCFPDERPATPVAPPSSPLTGDSASTATNLTGP